MVRLSLTQQLLNTEMNYLHRNSKVSHGSKYSNFVIKTNNGTASQTGHFVKPREL